MVGGIKQIWKTEGLPGFFTGYKYVSYFPTHYDTTNTITKITIITTITVMWIRRKDLPPAYTYVPSLLSLLSSLLPPPICI